MVFSLRACLRYLLALLAIAVYPLGYAAALEYDKAPAPKWIDVVHVDTAATVPQDQVSDGMYYLLLDKQVRVDKGERVMYQHFATKALNEQGVESVANIEISFDPAYEKLSLHSITIKRGAESISKLAQAQVRVFQQEKERDALIFNGEKTASILLEDVRVGDVVEYAYSLRGANPVFNGHHYGVFGFGWSAPVAHVSARLLWPQQRALNLMPHNGAVTPTVSETASHKDYHWDARNVAAQHIEKDAPAWFDSRPWVQWGDYADWKAVVQWAMPLYQLPQKPAAAIQVEIDRIAAQNPSPEARFVAALRFVQGDVRYLGIEVGVRSHAPNPPELVLARRFGDCKDKAMLTIALLRGLGIEAHPALVNAQERQAISQWQSNPGAFDHVIVVAHMNGKDIWVDPTRLPQPGSFEQMVQADYGPALVVRDDTTALAPMAGQKALAQLRKITAEIDSSEGFIKPVSYKLTTVAEGVAANRLRAELAGSSREVLQKNYLNYYLGFFPKIEQVGAFEVVEDANNNRVTLIQHYSIKDFWEKSDSEKRLEGNIAVPELLDFMRVPTSTVRNAPLALQHPLEVEHVTEVKLPKNWGMESDELRVDDPAFEFHRQEVWSGKTLKLIDHYKSKQDHVAVENVSTYAGHIHDARNGVGYVLYNPLSGLRPNTTGDSNLFTYLGCLLIVCFMIFVVWSMVKRSKSMTSVEFYSSDNF
jgi:Domain of Unknown Function with PDB structure (DUF3857)/Transglutaminase-like superfamily